MLKCPPGNPGGFFWKGVTMKNKKKNMDGQKNDIKKEKK